MSMRAASTILLAVAGLVFALPTSAQQNKPAAPAASAAPAQAPLPTLNMVVPQRDRDAAYAYYRAEVAAGRCPAPLVRKDKACVAPAPAKQVWKLDQPLPGSVKTEAPPPGLIAKLSPSPAGHQYMRVDTDILVIGIARATLRRWWSI